MTTPSRPIRNIMDTRSASIQFDANIDYILPDTDFDDCQLSGDFISSSHNFSGNFRSCSLLGFKSVSNIFTGADLLDCQISNSIFENHYFSGSHLTGCVVRNTKFVNCKITHINFSQNLFHNAVFHSCTFETFVFKNCKFYNCEFIACSTANHTFDSCFFDETLFDAFRVLPSTILMNVGLHHGDFSNPDYQSGRSIDGGKDIPLTAFKGLVSKQANGLQEKFSVLVFTSTGSESFVENLTALLGSNEHVSNALSRGFVEKLNLLTSLIGMMYSHNQIVALNLLQLQEYLNALSTKLTDSTNPLAHQFRIEIDALRLINAEEVSHIIELMDHSALVMQGAQYIAVSGNEHFSIKQFQRLLSDKGGIQVLEVRQRHSPQAIMMYLPDVSTLVWIISIIIATRFKYQLDDPELITTEQNAALATIAQEHSATKLVSESGAIQENKRVKTNFEVGLLSGNALEFGFKIANSFQNGLSQKYELSISPKRVIEFNNNLFSLLGSYYKSEK